MEQNLETLNTSPVVEESIRDVIASNISESDIDEINELGASLIVGLEQAQKTNIVEGIKNVEESINTLEASAKEGLAELVKKANADGSYDNKSDVDSEAKFKLVLDNVELVKNQKEFLDYLKNEKTLLAFMAYDTKFLEREVKTIKGFYRTIKFNDKCFSRNIKLAKAHKDKDYIRRNTAVFYCFIRFLNHLNKEKKLRSRIIYMNLTLSAITAVFASRGDKFFVADEVIEILHKKTIA
jgi:hypothetical protein